MYGYYRENLLVNPLTPMSDQDIISPYNINTISIRLVRRIKKNLLNSLNEHYKNCMVDSKENYKFDLGVKGLR